MKGYRKGTIPEAFRGKLITNHEPQTNLMKDHPTGNTERETVRATPNFHPYLRKPIVLWIGIAIAGLAANGQAQSGTPWLDRASGGESTNRVSITVEQDRRVIQANGIPDHPVGQFPNRRNPNRIASQDYVYTLPANPKPAQNTTPLGMFPFGIAVNGVVMDPGAAEWWNGDRNSGWQYEPLSGIIDLGVDANRAHVQPNGAYHYHGIPTALLQRLKEKQSGPILLGWAADGFPIYGPEGYSDPKNPQSPMKRLGSSYRVRLGDRSNGPGGDFDGSFVADYEYVADSGDLDECNGRFGVTPEYPEGTYHYVLTEEFPFIPRRFRGRPDASFMRRGMGPPGGGGRRPGGGSPPQPRF